MLIPSNMANPFDSAPKVSTAWSSTPKEKASIVEVADVGVDRLVVHDEARDDPGLAFTLSRLSKGPYSPTPIGVFRAVQRPDYGTLVNQQLVAASEQKGPGDLAKLLASGSTWTVE